MLTQILVGGGKFPPFPVNLINSEMVRAVTPGILYHSETFH